MKIRAAIIPIFLMSLYLVLSIHKVATISAIASVMRLFRFGTIPILSFFILDLLTKLKQKQAKHLFLMSLPIIIILFVTLFQLIALPSVVLSTHITGSIRPISWSLAYLCVLLVLNPSVAREYKNIFLTLLLLIFLVGILQYPHLILKSGVGISSILSNYGQLQGRVQNHGIFGSANEDANGLIALFPIALLWIEQTHGLKKKILKFIIFIFFPIALLFNGTRTALLISFPLITFLFYSNLSFKRTFIFVLASPILAGVFLLFGYGFFERAFIEDVEGGGTLGWRLEHAWIPAINHTLENSPIFGFGSRGWEYVAQQAELITPDGGLIPPHSGYVWVYISWGVIGLAAYLAFLLILLTESFRLAQSKKLEVAKPSKALFCSVVAYCLWSFISNANAEQAWLILFVIGSLIASLKIIEFSSRDKPLNLKDRNTLKKGVLEKADCLDK